MYAWAKLEASVSFPLRFPPKTALQTPFPALKSDQEPSIPSGCDYTAFRCMMRSY